MVLLDLGKMRPGQSREVQNCLHGDVLFHGRSWNVTAPGDNNPHHTEPHMEPHTGKVQYTMHAVLHLSGLAQTDFSEVKWSKGNS